jgi:ribonuclease G
MRKQQARDRSRTTVSGFTRLGLVEMKRKRTRASLARSACKHILREILRDA